jgi:hypothetical protein
MSGIEPGRPKTEEREAQYIWNGTHVLLGSGVDWKVVANERISVNAVTLHLQREAGGRPITSEVTMLPADLLRCRVES